jgi:hypothetical protein
MPYRYQNIDVIKYNSTGSQYYVNNVYPDIAVTDNDTYIISTLGDRLDLLANDFYGDVSLWWIIASANALPGDSLYPPVGMQLRIPTDVQSVISQYKIVNSKRQYGRF